MESSKVDEIPVKADVADDKLLAPEKGPSPLQQKEALLARQRERAAANASQQPLPVVRAAPVAQLREDMIANACTFLANPQVQDSPRDRKVAFLKHKGLTDAEIDEAFARTPSTGQTSSPPTAQQTQSQSIPQQPQQGMPYRPVGTHQMVPVAPPPVPPPPSRLPRSASGIAVLVVLCIGAGSLVTFVISRYLAPAWPRFKRWLSRVLADDGSGRLTERGEPARGKPLRLTIGGESERSTGPRRRRTSSSSDSGEGIATNVSGAGMNDSVAKLQAEVERLSRAVSRQAVDQEAALVTLKGLVSAGMVGTAASAGVSAAAAGVAAAATAATDGPSLSDIKREIASLRTIMMSNRPTAPAAPVAPAPLVIATTPVAGSIPSWQQTPRGTSFPPDTPLRSDMSHTTESIAAPTQTAAPAGMPAWQQQQPPATPAATAPGMGGYGSGPSYAAGGAGAQPSNTVPNGNATWTATPQQLAASGGAGANDGHVTSVPRSAWSGPVPASGAAPGEYPAMMQQDRGPSGYPVYTQRGSGGTPAGAPPTPTANHTPGGTEPWQSQRGMSGRPQPGYVGGAPSPITTSAAADDSVTVEVSGGGGYSGGAEGDASTGTAYPAGRPMPRPDASEVRKKPWER